MFPIFSNDSSMVFLIFFMYSITVQHLDEVSRILSYAFPYFGCYKPQETQALRFYAVWLVDDDHRHAGSVSGAGHQQGIRRNEEISLDR